MADLPSAEGKAPVLVSLKSLAATLGAGGGGNRERERKRMNFESPLSFFLLVVDGRKGLIGDGNMAGVGFSC